MVKEEKKIIQPNIPDIQPVQDDVASKSQFINFRETAKSLSEFLRVQDTNDANEGTFIVLNNTPAMQFADAATGSAFFSLMVPSDLTIASIQFIWSTPATSGNIAWQVDIGEGGNSDATNAHTTGGTQVTTAADGTANELNFTDIAGTGVGALIGGVDLKALKKGNLWGIQFTRNGADGADTLTNTVNLYGILVKYK
jgi:hypothetical protein|tara:strand:+ start:1498 stop:2088 length:591 start_codon:yes stop_codon:yes gene_type:complete